MHGFVRGIGLFGCGVKNSSRSQQQNEDQGEGSGIAPVY
jgi:hypothetical protein